MEKEYKNYGLRLEEAEPEAYLLGGLTNLPKTILQPNRDWTEYLPKYEPQFNEKFDSFGCTVWGTQNCIETLEKKLTGKESNYSERYTYILADITPSGADPHKIAEVIRETNLIPDELLPMTSSYEEFLTPKPMRPELLKEGERWSWTLKHEYVWRTPQSREAQMAKIAEALQYSPLGVAVTAWFGEKKFNSDVVVYVDRDLPNTHWCLLYGLDDYGYKIFDSYDQTFKILDFSHKISVCKRYSLTKKKVSPRWWLWELLRRFFV